MNEIYKSDLPGRAITVYLYLQSRADNKTMTCFPSVKTIAKDIKLSAATVKRALNDLEKSGFIQRTHQFRKNGAKSSNLYFVAKGRSPPN